MLSTERDAGRAPSNSIYEWSPTLDKTRRTITFWELRLVYNKGGGGREDWNRIQRMRSEISIEDTVSPAVGYIKVKYLMYGENYGSHRN